MQNIWITFAARRQIGWLVSVSPQWENFHRFKLPAYAISYCHDATVWFFSFTWFRFILYLMVKNSLAPDKNWPRLASVCRAEGSHRCRDVGWWRANALMTGFHVEARWEFLLCHFVFLLLRRLKLPLLVRGCNCRVILNLLFKNNAFRVWLDV